MKMEIVAILSLCVAAAFAQVLTVVDEPTPGNGYRLGKEYTLHCQGSLGPGCSIKWERNSESLSYTSDRIQVFVEPGNFSYVCRFVCNGAEGRPSNVKALTGQNLIRVEILNSGVPGDDWRPLENSIMELTCNYQMLSWEVTEEIEESIRPTFTWMSDGEVMGHTQTISFVAVPGYSKSIRCRAVYNEERLTSAAVSIHSTAEAEAPEVVFMQQGTNVESSLFISGVGYTGHCVSKSHSADATYLWTKDYFTIPYTPASRAFVLDSADGDLDDGVYRCRMHLQEREYCSITSVPMQVQAAGLFCQSESDCVSGVEYTSRCLNNRCECARGYETRGNVCAGSTSLLASGFLIVCGMILIRLL